jgi:hypothetical protein
MKIVPFQLNSGSLEMRRIQHRATTPSSAPVITPRVKTVATDVRRLASGIGVAA